MGKAFYILNTFQNIMNCRKIAEKKDRKEGKSSLKSRKGREREGKKNGGDKERERKGGKEEMQGEETRRGRDREKRQISKLNIRCPSKYD